MGVMYALYKETKGSSACQSLGTAASCCTVRCAWMLLFIGLFNHRPHRVALNLTLSSTPAPSPTRNRHLTHPLAQHAATQNWFNPDEIVTGPEVPLTVNFWFAFPPLAAHNSSRAPADASLLGTSSTSLVSRLSRVS